MRHLILLLIFFIISSCGKIEQKHPVQKEDAVKKEYLKRGEEITNLTQAELLKNVSIAMQKGGPEYAIEFCNIRALPLLDSLSHLNNCRIERIALKYRNPADMPRTELEKEQLNLYLEAHQQDMPLEPKVFLSDDMVEYYRPIVLGMDACLKCHGDPGTEIAQETLKKIKEHYPDDLATGFEVNDFRGAWKVTFNK
jgi:hypothetical protein